MPPYYALGFFQGSEAYSIDQWLNMEPTNYAKYDFPLEGVEVEQYCDQKDRIFTVSYDSFRNLPNMTQNLHTNNQKMLLGLYSYVA